MTDALLGCSWRRSWWTSRRNSSRRRTSWTSSPKAWKTPRRNWNCQRRKLQMWVAGTRPSLTHKAALSAEAHLWNKNSYPVISWKLFALSSFQKNPHSLFYILETHSHFCGTSETRAHSSTAGLIASQRWLWVHFDPGQSVCSTSETETFLCSHSWRMNTRRSWISRTRTEPQFGFSFPKTRGSHFFSAQHKSCTGIH